MKKRNVLYQTLYQYCKNKVVEIFQISVAFSETLNFTIFNHYSSNIFPWLLCTLIEVQVKKTNQTISFGKMKDFQIFPLQSVIYKYFINYVLLRIFLKIKKKCLTLTETFCLYLICTFFLSLENSEANDSSRNINFFPWPFS